VVAKNIIFRLSTDYKVKHSGIGKFLTYIIGLPFLEPEMIGECFVIDLASIQPEMAKIQTFSDYLVDTYIDDASDFPPEKCATCSSSMYLTSNACESFHSKFNSLFDTLHPSIY